MGQRAMSAARRAALNRERFRGEDRGTELERARCAAVCREAGCCCFGIHEIDPDAFDGKIETWDTGPEDGFESEIVRHDSRCPDALAARIEALALGKEE